ncbi:MAG: hypothetical protein R3316_04655 [Rhodovibrionaceae bacterium]|nr:hypothetical protein [Rhodovibrionaceae bacterium]
MAGDGRKTGFADVLFGIISAALIAVVPLTAAFVLFAFLLY